MRRRIIKISILLVVILISFFIASCADCGDYDEESSGDLFLRYYQYYHFVDFMYYEDGDREEDWYLINRIYNADTQDKGESDTPYRKYKYIFVELSKNISLDGIGFFLKTLNTDSDTPIKIELYYKESISVAQEDDYTCDMFRGTYEYRTGNNYIRFHLDGHGKCSAHTELQDMNTGKIVTTEYTDIAYEVKHTSTTSYFEVHFEAGDYEIYYNPEKENVFDGYIGISHRKSYDFKYTNDFDLGTKMYVATRLFKPGEANSFFTDRYTMDVTTDSGTVPVEGLKKVQLEAGNGLLIRIVNNCFDAPKYGLSNVEINFSNVVIRNKK